MFNLVITVISISLTAVMALVGAWYGGQAFAEGQARATANRLVTDAKQVAGAWALYAADHGGSYTLTNGNWFGGSVDLVPKYLSSPPTYKFPAGGSASYFNPMKVANNTLATSSLTSNTIYISYIPAEVCRQINFLATGTATLPSAWPGTFNTALGLPDLKPFACVNIGGADPYAIVYRVF